MSRANSPVSPEDVLEELKKIAFAEIGGEVKNTDKLKALEMLYKYLGMGEETADDSVVILDDVEEGEKTKG